MNATANITALSKKAEGEKRQKGKRRKEKKEEEELYEFKGHHPI